MRIALGDLRPDTDALLGRIAYLKLALFESASAVAGRATDLADREAITRVAAVVLEQHTELSALIEARGIASAAAMHPFTADIDRYRRRLAESGLARVGADAAPLRRAARRLLRRSRRRGCPQPEAKRVVAILERDIGHDALVAVLQAGLAADKRLGSRLALWGRRLVGDTLARRAVGARRRARRSGQPASTEERRVEPIMNDLIAAHTRRMDRLGLTA